MPAILEDALFALLAADSNVAALVGSRIYPGEAPREVEAPYLVQDDISETRSHSLQSAGAVATRRQQFTAWAATATEAMAVRAALRLAMDNFRGEVATASGPVAIDSCLSVGGGSEVFDDGPLPRLYGRMLDFVILYRA